jgi:hypothetical protein
VTIHNKLGQYTIILVACALAQIASFGLDKVWRRSLWRDAAITGFCVYVALFWFLP